MVVIEFNNYPLAGVLHGQKPPVYSRNAPAMPLTVRSRTEIQKNVSSLQQHRNNTKIIRPLGVIRSEDWYRKSLKNLLLQNPGGFKLPKLEANTSRAARNRETTFHSFSTRKKPPYAAAKTTQRRGSKQLENRVLAPSKRGYHPRSFSPTYQLLVRAKDYIEMALAKKIKDFHRDIDGSKARASSVVNRELCGGGLTTPEEEDGGGETRNQLHTDSVLQDYFDPPPATASTTADSSVDSVTPDPLMSLNLNVPRPSLTFKFDIVYLKEKLWDREYLDRDTEEYEKIYHRKHIYPQASRKQGDGLRHVDSLLLPTAEHQRLVTRQKRAEAAAYSSCRSDDWVRSFRGGGEAGHHRSDSPTETGSTCSDDSSSVSSAAAAGEFEDGGPEKKVDTIGGKLPVLVPGLTTKADVNYSGYSTTDSSDENEGYIHHLQKETMTTTTTRTIEKVKFEYVSQEHAVEPFEVPPAGKWESPLSKDISELQKTTLKLSPSSQTEEKLKLPHLLSPSSDDNVETQVGLTTTTTTIKDREPKLSSEEKYRLMRARMEERRALKASRRDNYREFSEQVESYVRFKNNREGEGAVEDIKEAFQEIGRRMSQRLDSIVSFKTIATASSSDSDEEY